MDTSLFANPDCPLCHGRGRVKTGEGISSWAICHCAIVGQRRQTAERVIERSFPGKAKLMTLNSYQTGGIIQNETALKVAKNFVDNWATADQEGWMLGFYGVPQSGKTHLSVGIAQAITKRYLVKPLLMNLPKALRTERERYSNKEIVSQLGLGATADLLILDDLGAEYEAAGRDEVSWLSEQIYTLLDERVMNNLPTVYTTNLTPPQLKAKYDNEAGKRILGRIESASILPALKVEPVDSIRNKEQFKKSRELLLK